MDSEFHYYITGIIAEAAGFTQDEAATIAYSCQFVDDNTHVIDVGDDGFCSCVTQTLEFMRPRNEWIRIWPVFHFVPDPGAQGTSPRQDGDSHRLCTIADASFAREMLRRAVSDKGSLRLYSTGIASHAYADTWAHQNFIGAGHEFNNVPGHPLLNIGHADVLHSPDKVGHVWDDGRLCEPQIDNNSRFLDAALGLYDVYRQEDSNSTKRRGLKEFLIELMASTQADRWAQYQQLSWLPEYDPAAWLGESLRPRGTPLAAYFLQFDWANPDDPYDNDWCRFQKAAREYMDAGIAYLRCINSDQSEPILADLDRSRPGNL